MLGPTAEKTRGQAGHGRPGAGAAGGRLLPRPGSPATDAPLPAVGQQRGSLLGVFGQLPEQVSKQTGHFHAHVPLRTSLPPAPLTSAPSCWREGAQGRRAPGRLGAREQGGTETRCGTAVGGLAAPASAPATPLRGAVDSREGPGHPAQRSDPQKPGQAALIHGRAGEASSGRGPVTPRGGAGAGLSGGGTGLRALRSALARPRPPCRLPASPGALAFPQEVGGRPGTASRRGLACWDNMLHMPRAQKRVCPCAGPGSPRRGRSPGCPAPTWLLPPPTPPHRAPPAPSPASRRLRLLPCARPGRLSPRLIVPKPESVTEVPPSE